MPLTLSRKATGDIIQRLLAGRDYREVVIVLINDEFVRQSFQFLRDVAKAKVDDQEIGEDWYKSEFLRSDLPSAAIATNAGMNMKTIANARQSATRDIVREVSLENYQRMREMVDELVALCEEDSPIDVSLKIQVGKVSVELTLNETVIVINALAVKRAAIRGSLWSTAGKRVEKPLMETMCRLFGVPESHYRIQSKSAGKNVSFEREIDFYLVTRKGEEKKCEVKLMGRGNPESADAVIARDSAVFVADKLSDMNKRQLDSLGVSWVELHSEDRFGHFAAVLEKLDIPQVVNPNLSESAVRAAAGEALSMN